MNRPRLPMSPLEKLHAGLTLIKQYQLSAPVCIEGTWLLIGDSEDQFMPKEVKEKLRDLGFDIHPKLKLFSFELEIPKD